MKTATTTPREVQIACLLSALACAGCAADAGDVRTSDAPSGLSALAGTLKALDRDLDLGSQGEDVRAVHAYLAQFGYFPNAELARQFPRWRPVVAEPPADWSVFDGHTREAISELQVRSGLPDTGAVDAATRALLSQPRCGVPDTAPATTSDKFSHTGRGWLNGSTIRWRLATNPDDGISSADARAAIASALHAWSVLTNLDFVETSATTTGPDVLTIQFTELIPGPSGSIAIAKTDYPDFGHVMDLDTDHLWSVTATTPTGAVDLQTIVMHEFGHAIGMDHAPPPATMRAVQSIGPGSQDRTLSFDDRIGVSARYDTWELKPGCGVGIAAGASTWVLGCIHSAGGWSIHKWNGSDWAYDATNMRAARISVGSLNRPWIVNESGEIYRRSSSDPGSGSWQRMPGCARDIGVSVAGSEHVWIVNCDQRAAKWNGSGWTTDSTDTPGLFIDVAQGGVPFMQDTGVVWRRTTNSPTTGNWHWMAGGAYAIGVGPETWPWALSWPIISNGFTPYVWNGQEVNGDGDEPEWYPVNGGRTGLDIDVEVDGRAWMVDNAGNIWRQSR